MLPLKSLVAAALIVANAPFTNALLRFACSQLVVERLDPYVIHLLIHSRFISDWYNIVVWSPQALCRPIYIRLSEG